MKSGVEHSHTRHTREKTLAGLNTLQIGRIVQRCQGGALTNAVFHRFIDLHRLGETLAAVHHPVTYGLDLGEVLEHALLRVDQLVANRLHGAVVVHNAKHFLRGSLAAALINKTRRLQPYAFNQTLAQHRLVAHVEHGEFQRGTAGVNHKNFHKYLQKKIKNSAYFHTPKGNLTNIMENKICASNLQTKREKPRRWQSRIDKQKKRRRRA